MTCRQCARRAPALRPSSTVVSSCCRPAKICAAPSIYGTLSEPNGELLQCGEKQQAADNMTGLRLCTRRTDDRRTTTTRRTLSDCAAQQQSSMRDYPRRRYRSCATTSEVGASFTDKTAQIKPIEHVNSIKSPFPSGLF